MRHVEPGQAAHSSCQGALARSASPVVARIIDHRRMSTDPMMTHDDGLAPARYGSFTYTRWSVGMTLPRIGTGYGPKSGAE